MFVLPQIEMRINHVSRCYTCLQVVVSGLMELKLLDMREHSDSKSGCLVTCWQSLVACIASVNNILNMVWK